MDRIKKILINLTDITGFDHSSIALEAFLKAESDIQSEIDLSKKEAQEEYKQFILNILDGHDIANAQNGFAPGTNSIRLAINSRVI